jgi:hypothetical protein
VSTILKVQNFLKIRGFDPGSLDGQDGPNTEHAWDSFEAICAFPVNSVSPITPSVPSGALDKILARAKADVGLLSTLNDAGTDHGNLGCADAVTRILHDELGFSLPKTLSTDELFDELKSAGWVKVDLNTPGAVIISPTCSAMHGHTGIVGDSGNIYSNSSATGKWSQNWTVARWVNYYERCGSYAFVPSATQAAASGSQSDLNVEGFEPLGSNAPIRGKFSLSSGELESLCTGSFAPYKLYASAIVEDCEKYGINPLFVLADLANQGVNPAYRNPWGISIDSYPYGQSNGRIKNGPRKFGESDWRLAFDRQFSVVASGKAYQTASTIAEWAKIDAPAGAENDVNGTNSAEGAEVGHLYNLLFSKLG